MLLEEAGVPYTIEAPDAYDGTAMFAVPAIKTPDGITMSQAPAILMALAQNLGLVPQDPIKAAKAMQLCLDGADMLSEAWPKVFAEKPERRDKWLAHMEACFALRAEDPVDYADFMCMQTMNE